VRHATRSVLRDVNGTDPVDGEPGATDAADQSLGQTPLAAELWSGLPLSAQVRFLTTSSMGAEDQVMGLGPVHSVAYVTVTAPAGRSATWATQAAISQGDLSSWVVGGSYAGRITSRHTLDAGVTYATQRYSTTSPLALVAAYDGTRTVGAMFAFDEWAFSETAALTYGTRIASYGYLADSTLVSPSLDLRWRFAPSTSLVARASSEAQAPGAEEFVPAPLAGMWLPPQRTFSTLEPGGEFQAERAQRLEVGLEHDWASFTVAARGFREEVTDQIVTIFGVGPASSQVGEVGHYFTSSAGDLTAYGWSVSVSRPVGSRVRGSIAYSLSHGTRPDGIDQDGAILTVVAPSVLRRPSERLHDLITVVETDIPETATRVYAACRLNTGFAASSPEEGSPVFGSRFDVQVNQRLPFLGFTNAEWEVLLALRNLFRDIETGTVYDELLVVRPPKRFVGGLTVRF
jgi:TonB dependent receptor-like, beta-barrel